MLARRRASSLSVRPARSYAVYRLLPPRGLIVARSRDLARRRWVLFGEEFGRSAVSRGGRSRSWWREIIDCVEKYLQTSYRAVPLYFSFPLWNHSLPARLTQFLHHDSIVAPKETHDRTRPPCGQHSNRDNRRKDAQVKQGRHTQAVRKPRKDAQV